MVDAFQEAIIAFYEYCMKGKYDQRRSSPKTMLFGIARYALLNAKKKQARMIVMEDMSDLRLEGEILEHFREEELTEKQSRIKEGLAILNENCRQIIRLFYYYQYSIESIVEEMGYQNGNVVRSHKSRCLKRLREYLKE
jgi:RNA polymerase sigma factor (sigma-70 family)